MKKLWSIFTDDMNKCIVTSAMTSIERHLKKSLDTSLRKAYENGLEKVWLNGKFEWRL